MPKVFLVSTIETSLPDKTMAKQLKQGLTAEQFKAKLRTKQVEDSNGNMKTVAVQLPVSEQAIYYCYKATRVNEGHWLIERIQNNDHRVLEALVAKWKKGFDTDGFGVWTRDGKLPENPSYTELKA